MRYFCDARTVIRLLLAVLVSLLSSFTGAFVPQQGAGWILPTISRSSSVRPLEKQRLSNTARFVSDVVDVEYEDVEEESPVNKKRPVSSTSTSGLPTKTLLDLSLDMDPELKNTPIPFEDGRSFINCKLAFMAELEGVNYAIGIPHEYSAAIAIQEADGKVIYLSPDDEDNVELMQMMASELKKGLGEELSLKRTPRVLTISGDLGKYTDGWQKSMFQTVDAETLLDDSDESEEFFHNFMREELGEELYQKTMEEDFEVDDEIYKLFDVPGIGEKSDDEQGLKDLLDNMLEEDPSKAFDAIGKDLDKEWVSLRLVGFNFKDGKSYSLVQMLKPFTLVARQVIDSERDVRFELLTAEEEKLVVPKLEELCEKELKEAGMTMKTPI